MVSITRENLELMIELQSAEIDAAGIEAALASLPAQAAALERQLVEVTGLVESRKNHAAELKKKYRMIEADFETGQSRVRKRKTQLDSVKSNKDYQALLKEIDDIHAACSRMEDEMLQCLDDIDAAEARLAEAENMYDGEKTVIEGKKREYEEIAAVEREKLSQLQAKIRKIADMLDPALKGKYDTIKSKSGGVAIVSVNGGICKGCHLNIPPQLYNELHRENELRLCPHCYRMIYVL
ncbi:MAG: C4-type zinc ribbon domain-containing protein [Desulfosalsimonadaceae bacterium]